jgi:hypothetical protein
MAGYHRYGKYGVALDIYFALPSPAASSSDRFITSSIAGTPIVAGDVQLSIDGGAVANTTNLPTQVTAAKGLYKLTLTAAEMAGTNISVLLVDQNGPAWRDTIITVETKLLLGQIDVDATALGGNSSGISAKGVGTGKGLNLAHNSDNSLMTNLFDTLEGTEPSAAVSSNATFGQILQNLKRRFFNLVTQTSSVQTMYRDDSVTSLQTMACSNDGTTQSKGKAS